MTVCLPLSTDLDIVSQWTTCWCDRWRRPSVRWTTPIPATGERRGEAWTLDTGVPAAPSHTSNYWRGLGGMGPILSVRYDVALYDAGDVDS